MTTRPPARAASTATSSAAWSSTLAILRGALMALMVRRVVCAYRQGFLPGEWLQTWRRLQRVLQRSRFDVKATLAPLDDLPAGTDVLVVPPDLREDARAAVPSGTPILVTTAAAAPGGFADLVQRLEAGVELSAERFDPVELACKPKIVTYRGQTLLD